MKRLIIISVSVLTMGLSANAAQTDDSALIDNSTPSGIGTPAGSAMTAAASGSTGLSTFGVGFVGTPEASLGSPSISATPSGGVNMNGASGATFSGNTVAQTNAATTPNSVGNMSGYVATIPTSPTNSIEGN